MGTQPPAVQLNLDFTAPLPEEAALSPVEALDSADDPAAQAHSGEATVPLAPPEEGESRN